MSTIGSDIGVHRIGAWESNSLMLWAPILDITTLIGTVRLTGRLESWRCYTLTCVLFIIGSWHTVILLLAILIYGASEWSSSIRSCRPALFLVVCHWRFWPIGQVVNLSSPSLRYRALFDTVEWSICLSSE
jgi:hypothetical protein